MARTPHLKACLRRVHRFFQAALAGFFRRRGLRLEHQKAMEVKDVLDHQINPQ